MPLWHTLLYKNTQRSMVLDYGNPEWKEKTGECLEGMEIVPSELKQNFSYFIDWLKDWACTRRVGLGTRFPYDNKWLIEPLSDSTVYMAFYTISRHVKNIEPSKLTPEFYDYVLLGKGKISEISRKSGVPEAEIEKIRAEFLYWYPMDFRLSAKDLVGNHLSFMMFHHTALFPKEAWPKGIVVFGMGLLEGNKMSSSKGNVVLLSDAMKDNGSDAVRLFLMSNAEPWQDFDWRESLVKNTGRRLKQFYEQVSLAAEMENDIPERDIDRWLMGRMQEAIDRTNIALAGFQTRKALQAAFFDLTNDLMWYNRRCEPRAKTLKEFCEQWVLLMAPFTPFTCEELWEALGHKGFVSVAEYPVADRKRIDALVNAKEDMIKTLREDIQHILEVSGIKPELIHVYPAPEWKRKAFALLRSSTPMKQIMSDPEMKSHGQEISGIMHKFRREEIPEMVLTLDDEYETLKGAQGFFEKEFGARIDLQKTPVFDPENKARFAVPQKPGLYIR